MDLPMAGQQPAEQSPAQQASQPIGQPQPPQQGKPAKGPFPSGKGEAMQFANDILQVIYSEKIYPNILKQLDAVSSVDIGKGVGIIAGHLMGNRAKDVRGQTGRKIEMKLIVDGTQTVVNELAEIAERNKYFQMNDAQKKIALAMALKMLDEMGGAKRPGQVQQGQQQTPQELPGGGINAGQ